MMADDNADLKFADRVSVSLQDGLYLCLSVGLAANAWSQRDTHL